MTLGRPDVSEVVRRLGKPILYFSGLAKVVGINESIFLSQLMYWTPRSGDPEGWVYKAAEEIEAETNLSYDQQLRLRERLKKLRVLEELHKRIEHRMYFRVVDSVLNGLLDLGGAPRVSPLPKSGNPSSGNGETLTRGVGKPEFDKGTESTTENTSLCDSKIEEGKTPDAQTTAKSKPSGGDGAADFRQFERDFYRLAGVTPKKDLRRAYEAACRKLGEDAVLIRIEEWVAYEGGALTLRKDLTAPKRYLAFLGVEAGLSHPGRRGKQGVASEGAAKVRDAEPESFRVFRDAFFEATGALADRRVLADFVAVEGRHGLQNILRVIEKWVVSQGGKKALGKQLQWAAVNFMQQCETLIRVEPRSDEPENDARDTNVVSAGGKSLYDKFRRRK